jgi:hypothetical protein
VAPLKVNFEMKGDIAIAGFLLTAEEWQAFDADARAQLIAAVAREGVVGAPLGGVISEPTDDEAAR